MNVERQQADVAISLSQDNTEIKAEMEFSGETVPVLVATIIGPMTEDRRLRLAEMAANFAIACMNGEEVKG